MSPFECQFGYLSPMFPKQESKVKVKVRGLVLRCWRLWQKAHAALQKAVAQQKETADHRSLLLCTCLPPPLISGQWLPISAPAYGLGS
ncbi:hypothetical protein SRHO_G00179510 [Serrasalmus rhombeus]